MDLSEILNALGEDRTEYMNSVVLPIFQTAMFAAPHTAAMREMIRREAEQPFYSRGTNPTTDVLRQKIAALEAAEDCLVFGSGSGAIAAGVLANLRAGDHIVSVSKPYSWTARLFKLFLPRFGISTTFVDGTDAENYARATQANTKLYYLESPNSWTYEMQDIAAVAAIAQTRNILTMCDNSYATPIYQQPLTLGVDMVAHSATKYLSGHSDTVAGALCGSAAMMRQVFNSEFMTLGAVLAPFNAWLLLRGLRTLPLRLERSAATAQYLVERFVQHPAIERVYYPHSPSHPQYALAQRQMNGSSGMFTIAVKAHDIAQMEQVCNRLRRFLLAVSWGGYESLIFPACTLYASDTYATPDLAWNLVRVSVGLEDPALLWADWEQALSVIS